MWTPDARIAVIGTHPEFGAAFWLLPEDTRDATSPAAKLSRLLVRMRSVNPPPFELSRDGAALLVTGAPMGFIAILGVVALAGMIIRNSVILVDQIEHERKRGPRAVSSSRSAAKL